MENPVVTGLRSRSRSKTPFLRSSCDREHCLEGDDHVHKSGRKTPVKRKSSTPIKQLPQQSSRLTAEPIREEDEDRATPPVTRMRQSSRVAAAEKLLRTSDYSSEESLDRVKGRQRKEYIQNEINSSYEKVSSSRQGALSDFTLSPISRNVTSDRSSARIGSPALSGCSTDSSFAELTLADASTLLQRDPSREHLPYRLYKYAGEYWNKYPKTDYTYSEFSKDRVELAPGQVALPNMSRRSIQHARLFGFNSTIDETDTQKYYSTAETTRKRYTSVDSSDEESYLHNNGGYKHQDNQHWWLTQLLINMVTTITTTVSDGYRKVVGPKQRYPYSAPRSRQEAGLVSRVGSVAAAPFVWMYTVIKTIVTTTVTTVTETITPNHVSERERYTARSYSHQQVSSQRRRWWPWLLLLLLPAIGYGCYNYKDQFLPQPAPILVDNYKSPEIVIDPDLSKRLSALENWAFKVDDRLKLFDQKLSKFDNLEAQIEQYSLKYLQNNIIQILNLNENSDALAEKLKQYFDKQYVSKDQMQIISQEIHEKLINSWKPEMDEDKIRSIIQEYLSVFEKRQMELIVERIREYVREIEIHHVETGFDVEAVKRIVAGMLEVYDADKIGLVDYALESAGGQVISTKCTELYQIKTKQYSILGMPIWWVYTSPRFALTPGAMPAECWAFQGFPGYLVVRLYAVIEVTGFSIEHMSRLLAADGKIESAPKNFSVYGLHDELDPEPHLFGEYMYDANGTSIQYFPVKYPKTTNIGGVQYPVAYDTLELRIESNHGNPTYTCLYRFRVHGNPLSDIRKATDDSIRESET